MQDTRTRLSRRAALLAIGAVLAVPGMAYAGKDDEKDKKGKKESGSTDKERSEREDRETSGQIVEINTLKDPPELFLANTDGIVKVRMLTKDLIAKNGLRIGDHISVIGEKISEVEFDCQELNIDGHVGDDDDNDDDD